MWVNILSIIANIVYFVVLNKAIYTDRSVMPGGEIRKWHRSPVDRLNISGQSFLLYLQIALALVSVITGVLLLLGVRSNLVKKIQLIATIGSTLVFILILIVTSNSHAKYS